MSPLPLRRYRAERLLRQEFAGLRGKVLAVVKTRLRARGVSLDPADLEACYAHAWHGLYASVLSGEQIENPTGWLVLVTFRRALDEHRARRHEQYDDALIDERVAVGAGAGVGAGAAGGPGGAASGRSRGLLEAVSDRRSAERYAQDRDIAGELDDQRKLRQVFEALRSRLSKRECEAASLCYLQGLTRSEAAAQMGISEARMRKLMEGTGSGSPGVASKVGALLQSINGGTWCEEQGSLMRGFAFGILDPNGERYTLALLHQRDCPACRNYILSLRGLAAILPPVLLPIKLGVGAAAGAGVGAGLGASAGAPAGAGSAAAGSAGSASGVGSGGATAVSGAGALSASGVAGVGVGGASGGGWLLAGGPLGAKLAVGCVLALSVGAGCVTLVPRSAHRSKRQHRAHAASASTWAPPALPGSEPPTAPLGPNAAGTQSNSRDAAARSAARTRSAAPALQAPREFGPESEFARASAGGSGTAAAAGHSASAPRASAAHAVTGSPTPSISSAGAGSSSGPQSTPADSTAARREFGVG